MAPMRFLLVLTSALSLAACAGKVVVKVAKESQAAIQRKLDGMPKALRPGSRTGYDVWISKPGYVHVRWTAASPKPVKFSGTIECEALWREADRIRAGKAGTAVQITEGGGVLKWNANTANWIDGFDAIHPPTEYLRFELKVDGQPAQTSVIRLGKNGARPSHPIFYWLRDPPRTGWKRIGGLAPIKPGQARGYWIGVDKAGRWVIRFGGKATTQQITFSGNVRVSNPGRIDLVTGWKQAGDTRAKLARDTEVQFEYKLKGGEVDGFRLLPNVVRKVELELYINGQDAKPNEVFLGATAQSPKKKGSPLEIKR